MSDPISYFEEIKRKAVHLSSLWMVAATLILPRITENGRYLACGLFALLLAVTVISEHDYANGGRYLGRLYGLLFGKMLRNKVKKGQWIVSGGAFVLASALLANLLFPPVIAAGGLAVMLTGDAAAALIGRKFGRHPAPNRKSWEGVAAFLLAGYGAFALVMAVSNVPAIFYLAGIPAVILAAAAELFEKQLHLDDNFSIPLCVGAVLMLTVWLMPQKTVFEKAEEQILSSVETIENNRKNIPKKFVKGEKGMQIEFSGVYGALLQEYNVARLRELNRERSARIAALKTREDAEKYVAEVRAKIAASFALPERPAKLAVTHCGTVETPECRIEKIIFESRKDFPVTAHCFLPREFSGKLPGVLFLCGHAGEGKLSAAYQTAAATLAANGCVVLLVDPISQGERWQFLNVPDAAGVNGLCTNEHNMLGKQLWLCDEFFGTWRAHDALCGLDYLLSRPEVDTTRVGVTGNSGGGTMTTFVQALDPRFTMAAPSCYVTSWLRNIENELPADVEQIPPGILASGCEMGDFVLAYAPRPVLLLGQKNDFFDPRGLTETYEECRKVYALLGAEENLRLFIGPTNHGYSVENRCSMYKFFSEHADLAAIRDEVSLAGVPAEKLWCTATGQVADMPDKKQVHDLIVEMLDGFAAERSALDLPALKKLLEEKYGYPSSAAVPYCRSLRPWGYRSGTPRQMMFSRFGIESEPGMIVPLLMRDSKSRAFQYIPAMEEVTLYIPHLSAAEELVEMASDGTVIGVDVRGIGAARSYNCDYFCMNNFFHPYGQDYHYNACSIMFGSSILADRLRDLFSTIAYIKSCGVKKIHLAGRGQGAVPALFAAVLSDDIASLKLYDAPVSFDAMARTRVTLWPHAVMPRGILKYTDLPDMYKALEAAGKLEIINFADQLFRASRV